MSIGRCGESDQSLLSIVLNYLAAMWFFQLDNIFISTWNELVEKFMSQFRDHIVRSRIVISLSNVKLKKKGNIAKLFD